MKVDLLDIELNESVTSALSVPPFHVKFYPVRRVFRQSEPSTVLNTPRSGVDSLSGSLCYSRRHIYSRHVFGTTCRRAANCLAGFGLLYYGQNYLIYPSAFPPGSRSGEFIFSDRIRHPLNEILTEVAVPSTFGLPYDDVELVTPDNLKYA